MFGESLYSTPVQGPEGSSVVGPFLSGALLAFFLSRKYFDFEKSVLKSAAIVFGIYLLAGLVRDSINHDGATSIQIFADGVKMGIVLGAAQAFFANRFTIKKEDRHKKRSRGKRSRGRRLE